MALSQACTDNARTVCDEAQALERAGSEHRALWIKSCDAVVQAKGKFISCEAMGRFRDDYDDAMATRRKLKTMFLAPLDNLT
ncbi:hypothetical protein V474_20895 [Novosphingobium barchaimii LL02]|uniref:Uncharacterized protein n=1 Tax=Novosphingobium barchaimii LL02 TaxID=1114963 RepID=A0A0J7XRY4_9SPHN|nr:hypothetical protein V474_20895 [Novosphingobium barchaimii LL02]